MTTIIARSAESVHWYQHNGAPQYTVKAKDGSDRPTTLRDARKLNLVPSVTTILKIAAKPGLEAWKLNQMLLAALTLPKGELFAGSSTAATTTKLTGLAVGALKRAILNDRAAGN